MPTSELGLPVPARHRAAGCEGILLDQNLPQLLDLLRESLHQREVRRVGQLPLEVLQVTQTKTAGPEQSDGFGSEHEARVTRTERKEKF